MTISMIESRSAVKLLGLLFSTDQGQAKVAKKTRTREPWKVIGISWPQERDDDRDQRRRSHYFLVRNIEKDDQNRYDTLETKVKSSLDPLAPCKFSHPVWIKTLMLSSPMRLFLVKARGLNSLEPSRHKLVTSSQAYPLILLLAKLRRALEKTSFESLIWVAGAASLHMEGPGKLELRWESNITFWSSGIVCSGSRDSKRARDFILAQLKSLDNDASPTIAKSTRHLDLS
ncbi:hypothetical protein Bca52824_052888 [Brassica carinata]|uniref:Uncharacterized protein n=1 Tax=Brassica carinata TaxID=52824 RepID=A0A8X7R5J8_BRACI|nr:hypothetical protein Bca52824_052888 [Brassica carinata]